MIITKILLKEVKLKKLIEIRATAIGIKILKTKLTAPKIATITFRNLFILLD